MASAMAEASSCRLGSGNSGSVDPPSPVVFAQHTRVAGAESETGLTFPVVAEPVHLIEFDGTMALDEVGEHATPSHRGELSGISDQDHPPAVLVGKPGQLRQFGGRSGARFIDDHRCTWSEVVDGVGWSRPERVFGEKLVQRISVHAGFGGEDFGCRRGGSHSEHTPTLNQKIGYTCGEGGGLAGTGRTHDQLQTPMAGNGSDRLSLTRRHPVASNQRLPPGPRHVTDQTSLRPSDDLFLFVEDGLGG